MYKGNTIAFPPCKSDFLNIYVNNKLVNRSFNNIDSLLRRSRPLDFNKDRGQSESAMIQPKHKMNMIIPYLEGQITKTVK